MLRVLLLPVRAAGFAFGAVESAFSRGRMAGWRRVNWRVG